MGLGVLFLSFPFLIAHDAIGALEGLGHTAGAPMESLRELVPVLEGMNREASLAPLADEVERSS